MSKEITKLIKDITDFNDLQEFANTQYNTILAQTKKIHKLEEELEILKIKLNKAEQSDIANSALNNTKDINDAETICLIQLALLKNKSMLGELTLEETKKAEIYAKTLNLIKSKPIEENEAKEVAKATSTEELLKNLTLVKSTEQ